MKITGGCHCGHINLRGRGRSGDSQGLPLHGLPKADRHGVSHQHRQSAGDVSADERVAEDLRQDCREREQAGARVLPGVRHADLFHRARGEPVNLRTAGRRD
jgi:hypothetical protein